MSRLIKDGLVAVIRMADTTHLLRVVEALAAGGVTCIEITMTTPDAIGSIETVSRNSGGEILVGAGTVIDSEAALAAISAGAEFIVGPVFKEDILTIVRGHDGVYIPGALTPTEILRAWEAGADAVKIFPATVLGPQYVKDIKGPLPHIRLTPTGGITIDNAADFIRAGADFLGAGSSLLDKEAIRTGQWEKLSRAASQFLSVVQDARRQVKASGSSLKEE